MSDLEVTSREEPLKAPESPELPELTLKNVVMDIINGAIYFLTDPNAISFYYVLTILLESLIGKLIITKVDYTEIDFETYCQQVRLFKDGELNYNNIFGDSGPIVYPAGFVYLYSLLDAIYYSDGLSFIQNVFRFLLVLTLIIYAIIYSFSNSDIAGNGNLFKKPWIYTLIVISKRLQSIYLLRLFNDCFVTLFIGLMILLFQSVSFIKSNNQLKNFILYLSSTIFSIAISIKMNALLFAPGVFYLLYLFHEGKLISIFLHIVNIILIQIIIGWRFLQPLDFNWDNEIRNAYLSNAFNFQRKFLYKWTINWKFLPEDAFQNDIFHKSLLGANTLILLVFILRTWCTNFNPFSLIFKSLSNPFKTHFKINLYQTSSPSYIFYVLSISNLIGVICSRSLHYQFLSWYQFQLPYLYSLTDWNPYFYLIFHGLHELCWCTYPSNERSSFGLVGLLSFLLISILYNNHFKDYEVILEESDEKKEK